MNQTDARTISRKTPSDNQVGDPLAGPYRFAPSCRPKPDKAITFGVDPEGYLFRAFLWEVFGVPGVSRRSLLGLGSSPSSSEMVVVGNDVSETIRWDSFVEWLGAAQAVVDLQAFAEMVKPLGYSVTMQSARDDGSSKASVFLHNRASVLYPEAPRIKVVADGEPGFAIGDEFHFYHRDKAGALTLRSLVDDVAWKKIQTDLAIEVWGVESQSLRPAIFHVPTPSGASVTVMDLQAVNRLPESSGVETLAIQVFCNAVGLGNSVFGKFLSTYESYETFLQAIQTLVAATPECARLEPIGHSSKGRDMWVLKIGYHSDAAAVLMSTAIHSLEWGPTYGVLRYVRFLLDECRHETSYARDLLSRRQLWWIVCANPDGWETRDQEAFGINLNRNFPTEGWHTTKENDLKWDAYNRRFVSMGDVGPRVRGATPGSEAESQALMSVLKRAEVTIPILVDFHETTAPSSFYHQYMGADQQIPYLSYHRELVDDFKAVCDDRFYANANVMAYGEGLMDFETYRMQILGVENRLIPSALAGCWQGYATEQGLRAPLLEVVGCDCTHYQTICRTDIAALAAEQVMANETGRLLRNPWGQEKTLAVHFYRPSAGKVCQIFSGDGTMLQQSDIADATRIEEIIPAGGWLRLQANV